VEDGRPLPVELVCEDDNEDGFCGTDTVRLLLSTRVFATSANSGAVLNIYTMTSSSQHVTWLVRVVINCHSAVMDAAAAVSLALQKLGLHRKWPTKWRQ